MFKAGFEGFNVGLSDKNYITMTYTISSATQDLSDLVLLVKKS